VANDVRGLANAMSFHVSKGLGEDNVYAVESAGGLAPAQKTGKILFRYADTGVGAVVVDEVGSTRIAVAGFPIECITGTEARRAFFAELLK
jgi:hypothetical protein